MSRWWWPLLALVVALVWVQPSRAQVLFLVASPYQGDVVLNEVLANQTCVGADATSNDEFVELYIRRDVDLSGWQLSDGNVADGDTDGSGGFVFTFPPGSVFSAGDYVVVWVGDSDSYGGLKRATGAAAQFYVGLGPKLSNTGDDLWLFDAAGRIVDYMAYGSGSAINDQSVLPPGMWGANAQRSTRKGQSLAVSPNGTDADDGTFWERTGTGTAPGPTTQDTDDQTCGGYARVSSAGKPNHPPPPPPVLEVSPAIGSVVLNEVLAAQTCSSRREEHDEFVELYVRAPVDLSGWQLSDGNIVHGETDGSGGFVFTFPPGSRFSAGDFVVVWLGPPQDPLGIKQAPLAAAQFYAGVPPKLNNRGDDLWLFDDQGRIVDYMAYGDGTGINPQTRLPAGFWRGLAPAGDRGQSIALVPNGWDTNDGGNWMPSGQVFLPGPWAEDVDPTVCQGRDRRSSVGDLNHCVARLPCTGFPPQSRFPEVAALPARHKVVPYELEIPKLGVRATILMAPLAGRSWDVAWLWDQVGWLEGTAFPGTPGNTVLTGHSWLPNQQPGPLAYLDRLRYGDVLWLRLGRQVLKYTVVSNVLVQPDALWPLRNRRGYWLTLITCAGYDPLQGRFRYRRVVQARR